MLPDENFLGTGDVVVKQAILVRYTEFTLCHYLMNI